jgi:hypothetical protein
LEQPVLKWGFEERWLADTELLVRAGAKFGGRRTSTTHQSTIDIAEPGREVERAAVIFAHGERDSQQAIASPLMAFSLLSSSSEKCR